MGPDPSLLGRIKEGDQNAFKELFDLYWDKLLCTALAVLKDRDAAEDAVQEVFINIWTKRVTLDIRLPYPYLKQCVKLKCFDILRKGPIPREILDKASELRSDSSADDHLHFLDTSKEVESILQKLPAKSREVFRMNREEHLSHKEIAQNLDLSVKAVEYHMTQALRQLRKVRTFLFTFI